MDLTEIWRYPRFFTSCMTLTEEDLHHAKRVLRVKAGDKIVLCDDGKDYLCEFSGENCQLSIVNCQLTPAEARVHVRLFQCLPKFDKFDTIVRQAVELGASEIIPVLSARCVSRPAGKAIDGKIARWNKIAHEAAKQSGRGKIPPVRDVLLFENAARVCKPDELHILFYECADENSLRLSELFANALTMPCAVNIFIGSEGGFEPHEAALARESGWAVATLGVRILRVDTAAAAALTLVMNATGNL